MKIKLIPVITFLFLGIYSVFSQLPADWDYDENAVLKPLEYAGYPATSAPRGELRSTGGMEYYFQLAMGKYLMAGDDAFVIFRSNDRVPVAFVEIRSTQNPGTRLSSYSSIPEEMGSALEECFGKPVALSKEIITLNYDLFKPDRGVMPGAHINMVLDTEVNRKLGKDTLYIYYMADTGESRFNSLTITDMKPYGDGAAALYYDNTQSYVGTIGPKGAFLWQSTPMQGKAESMEPGRGGFTVKMQGRGGEVFVSVPR